MNQKYISLVLASTMALGMAQPAFAATQKLPKLTDVSVGEGMLNQEDNTWDYTVTVRASGSDAALEHISVQFENPANENTANLVLRAEDLEEEGVYTGTLSISAYAQEGSYRLNKVILQEQDGDRRFYCREEDLPDDPDENKKALPKSVTIKLASGVKTEDKDAPKLDCCALSKAVVQAETAVEFSAQITETGSDVDYVKARFLGDNGRGISVTLKLVDGSYVGYLSGNQVKHPGTYTLQRIMVKDMAGNRAVYTDKSVSFTVINEDDIQETAEE